MWSSKVRLLLFFSQRKIQGLFKAKILSLCEFYFQKAPSLLPLVLGLLGWPLFPFQPAPDPLIASILFAPVLAPSLLPRGAGSRMPGPASFSPGTY